MFEDSLYLQAEIYYNCYSGALLMCEALCEAFAGEYKLAFYKAGKARKHILEQTEICATESTANGMTSMQMNA